MHLCANPALAELLSSVLVCVEHTEIKRVKLFLSIKFIFNPIMGYMEILIKA